MAAAFTVTVQMQFAPEVWTDVSDDVQRPLRWRRGMQGNGPTDTIANTGTFEFSLRNDETNSQATLGLYSWNGPDCRAGFQQGTPVQLLISSGPYEDVPVWTGRLHRATPDVGAYGPRRVHCVCQDIMGALSDAEVLEVPRQLNKTEVEVLNAVLDSLPADYQPVARDFDDPDHLFPVALDDIGAGEPAWGVCEKVITSARGLLYPLGSGALRYRTFTMTTVETSRYTFTDAVLADLVVPASTDNVFTGFIVITHPKVFGPIVSPDDQLAAHEGTLAIPAGETVELFLSYRDPERPEVKVGGTDFVDPPVPFIDYEFNTEEDGSGGDLTGGMSVTADFFAADVKLTIENLSGVTAHRIRLQVRGRGIYDQQPVSSRAGGASYGAKPVEIDMPYQSDALFAQEIATFLQASYQDVADQVDGLAFYPDDSDELMEQALTLEIGHVVDASELVAVPEGVSVFIQSIAGELDTNDHLTWYLGLAPRIVEDALLDTEAQSFFDRVVDYQHAPVNTIGFMEIGYSEIA